MTSPKPRRRRVVRFVLRWTAFLVLLWLAAVVVMKSFENRLIYVGAHGRAPWADRLDDRIEDVWLTAADGTRLHARLLPHDGGAGPVLFSHGNGGNVSYYGPTMHALRRQLGRPVLVYDYPGYGKSEGSPSEAGCYAAGEAAYRWLTETRGAPPGRVVLLGESLGSGVAVELATRHDHAALVLLYPFTSLPAAAKWHYPWLPCGTFMSNRFDNLSKIGRCRRPVFVVHGTDDTVVPFDHGQRLYEAANEPKRFLAVQGGMHGCELGDPDYADLRQFLDEPR